MDCKGSLRWTPGRLGRFAGFAAGVLSLAATLGAAVPLHVPPAPVTQLGGALLRVSPVSPTDAWAVGNSNTNLIRLLHWTGTAWTQVSRPRVSGALADVTALSSTDAWAVGQRITNTGKTLALHWNGTTWAQVASPNPGVPSSAVFLADVSATSSSDVWAVGEYSSNGSVVKPLVLHWNGTSWTQVASPHPPGTFGSELLGVDALSPGDAWAVGEITGHVGNSTTLILHWNGTAWTQS